MNTRVRWGRVLGTVAVVAGAGAAAVYLPGLLRETDAFQVRKVEVVGTRFVEPYELVQAAGLDHEANLFDDVDVWHAGVLAHPMVDSVRVRRAFPSTVTIEVVEAEPVALVAQATLRPVSAEGRVLNLDPAGAVLDLPVVMGAEVKGDRLQGASAAAIGTVAALLRDAPDIGDQVSEVRVEGSAIRVVFRDGRADALLPAAATPLQLAQLRLALADLRARGELEGVRTIDVRYRDQVVVSFLDTPVI